MSKAKPFNPLTMTDEELIKHCDKQVQALRMALDMIECEKHDRRHVRWAIVDALKEWKPALAKQPAQQEPVLQEIEQYRLQMAGISTAAIGYWKESDGIHPDYDTIALRDVAKLYAKYDELYRAQRTWVGLLWGNLPEDGQNHDFLRGAVWAEAKLKELNT